MPGNPDRPRRPRKRRGRGVEPLEGRQLLSGLSSFVPTVAREVANWSGSFGPSQSSEGERTSLIAELSSSTEDGSLSSILSPSVGFISSPPLVASTSEAISAREAPPNLAIGDGHVTVGWATATSAFQVQAGGVITPDEWTVLQAGHTSLMAATTSSLPFYGPMGDPTPFPGPFRGDPQQDWLFSRPELVDLLFVSDPTSTAPSSTSASAGLTNGETGLARGPDDFAIGLVVGQGAGRGLSRGSSNQGGLAPPVHLSSPRMQGPTEDAPARDDSAQDKPDVTETAQSEGIPEGAVLADETIDEVIAREGTALSLGADLLASFSPFDRVAVENAIDQFLGQIGDFGAVLSHLEVSAGLLPNLVAAAGAIGVFEVVRRRARGPSDEEGDDPARDADAGPPGLPGLPRGWTLEEL